MDTIKFKDLKWLTLFFSLLSITGFSLFNFSTRLFNITGSGFSMLVGIYLMLAFFGTIFIIGFLFERKAEKFIPIYVLIFIISYFIGNASFLNDFKSSFLLYNLNKFEENLGSSSTETIELRKYIVDKDFKAISEFNPEKMYYFDDKISIIVESKRFNNKALTSLMNKILIDGHINRYEFNLITKKKNELLHKKLREG